jgi:hypothetical protein
MVTSQLNWTNPDISVPGAQFDSILRMRLQSCGFSKGYWLYSAVRGHYTISIPRGATFWDRMREQMLDSMKESGSWESDSRSVDKTRGCILWTPKSNYYPSQLLDTILEACTPSKQYPQIQFVPHRKHLVSTTTTNRLMLFREIVVAYCEQ